MAKIKNDYFEMIKKQAEYCVAASDILEKMFCNFSASNTAELRDKIHAIEHEADKVHHDILAKLYVEFITPIDQEDILRLVQIIDDITDALDEAVQDFYIYDLNVLPSGADDFVKLVNRCVKAFAIAASELKNFKKPAHLRTLLKEVNTIEGEADKAYNEGIRHLFSNNTDAKTLISHKAVFESLENCCDLCEHAADVIEQIIIKNT